jgi:hypothetical protein
MKYIHRPSTITLLAPIIDSCGPSRDITEVAELVGTLQLSMAYI